MKKSSALLILLIFFYSINSLSQETLKRKYFIDKTIIFGKNDAKVVEKAKKNLIKATEGSKKYNRILRRTIPQDKISLKKDEIKLYKDLTKKNKNKIENQLNLIRNNLTESIEFINKDGYKLIVKKKQVENSHFPDSIALKVPTDVVLGNCYKDKCKGNVLFEKNKLFVNPWNFVNDKFPDDKKEQYFKLKDGQTAIFRFKETTISTFTVPIKYRFRDDPISVESTNEMMETVIEERTIPETFTTGLNISVFAGQTWGKTKFNHRIKVGNKTITNKNTFGLLLGTAAETLSTKNTDGTADAPKDKEEFTIGLLSLGVGYVRSRNKFAFGIFYGWDFGVGSISNTWNYDNRPWIGIGIGYDIFKL